MWQFDVQPSSSVGQAEADDVQSAEVAMASCDFIELVIVAKREFKLSGEESCFSRLRHLRAVVGISNQLE